MAFKAIYFLVVLICGASGEFVLVFVVVVENEFYIFIKSIILFCGDTLWIDPFSGCCWRISE